jgi:hypothetical protein
MPTSVQYPLERREELQQKWARLLQERPSRKRSIASSLPPRDHDDDDDDDDDEKEEDEVEEREPAVIREPDKDE